MSLAPNLPYTSHNTDVDWVCRVSSDFCPVEGTNGDDESDPLVFAPQELFPMVFR